MKFFRKFFSSKSSDPVKIEDPVIQLKHHLYLFLLDVVAIIVLNVLVYFHSNMMKNYLFVACYGFLCFCLACDFWNFIKFKFNKKGD